MKMLILFMVSFLSSLTSSFGAVNQDRTLFVNFREDPWHNITKGYETRYIIDKKDSVSVKGKSSEKAKIFDNLPLNQEFELKIKAFDGQGKLLASVTHKIKPNWWSDGSMWGRGKYGENKFSPDGSTGFPFGNKKDGYYTLGFSWIPSQKQLNEKKKTYLIVKYVSYDARYCLESGNCDGRFTVKVGGDIKGVFGHKGGPMGGSECSPSSPTYPSEHEYNQKNTFTSYNNLDSKTSLTYPPSNPSTSDSRKIYLGEFSVFDKIKVPFFDMWENDSGKDWECDGRWPATDDNHKQDPKPKDAEITLGIDLVYSGSATDHELYGACSINFMIIREDTPEKVYKKEWIGR